MRPVGWSRRSVVSGLGLTTCGWAGLVWPARGDGQWKVTEDLNEGSQVCVEDGLELTDIAPCLRPNWAVGPD